MSHMAASRDRDAGRHQRHRPEQTLLYQIIDEYYPTFSAHLAEQGRALPGYVQREFEDYLKCGRLEHGFLRVRCESCHAEHLVAFSCTNCRRFRRTARLLPQLRCTADGRKCRAVDRRGGARAARAARAAHAPVGAEFPVPVTIPVC